MKTQLINPTINEQTASESSVPGRSRSTIATEANNLKQLMQSYQAPQQVQYLHLQTDIELLHQQLRTLQQRQGVSN